MAWEELDSPPAPVRFIARDHANLNAGLFGGETTVEHDGETYRIEYGSLITGYDVTVYRRA